MPYIKTNWLDRLVQFPSKFRFTNNGDGTANIEEEPGNVFVAGTPVSAANLNKMENGIEAVTTKVDNELVKATSAQALAGTASNVLMTPQRVTEFARQYGLGDVSSTSVDDVNDIKTSGHFRVLGNKLNLPTTNGAFEIISSIASKSYGVQIAVSELSRGVYVRSLLAGVFSDWQPIFGSFNTATTQEAIAGLLDTKGMTPLKVLQSIGANALRKYTIPRKTSNAINFIKIAEIDNSTSGNARLSLLISGIAVFTTNSTGSVIVNLSARGGIGLDVTVLSEVSITNASTFTTINNTNTNKLELWMQSLGYQSDVTITVLQDTLGNTPIGSLAEQSTLTGNQPARKVNRTGDLSNLTTADKLSLVGAINEINAKTVKATTAQAQAGTDDNAYMTPLKVRESDLYRTLDGVSNLNSATTKGKFLIPANQLTTNVPDGFSNTIAAYLEVNDNQSKNVPVQTLIQAATGRIWLRSRQGNTTSSTWTQWRRLDNEVATTAQAQEGTDDNSIMTPLKTNEYADVRLSLVANSRTASSAVSDFPLGISSMSSSSTSNNLPGTYGVLTTFRSGNYGFQIFSQANSDIAIFRNWDAGSGERVPAWKDWQNLRQTIATTAQAQAGINDITIMTPLKVKQAIGTLTDKVVLLPRNQYDGLTPPMDYPLGETFLQSFNPTNKFNGVTNCGIHTIMHYENTNVKVGVQFLYPNGNEPDRPIQYRYAPNVLPQTWGPWHSLVSEVELGSLTNLQTANKTNIVASLNEVNTIAKGVASRYGVYPAVVTNWNNANDSGQYMSNPQSIANGPSGVTSWLMGEVFAHNAQFAKQVVRELTGNREWERRKDNGVWTAWVETSPQTLFTSVSNGKSAIASAITDKGVNTAGDATFATMAQNIRNIETGKQAFIFRTAGSTSQFIELGFRPEIVIFRASLPNSTSQIQQTYIDPALTNFQSAYNRLQSSIGGAVGYADIDIFPNGLTIHNLTPGMNYQLFAFQGVIPEGTFSSNPGVGDRPSQI